MSIKIYEKVIAELETLRIKELAETNGDPARVAIAEQHHAEAVKIAKAKDPKANTRRLEKLIADWKAKK